MNIPPTSLEKMQAYKVPFMYNFSSTVVPRPLDWRDHIDVTGYWFLDHSHGDYEPPEDLSKFIASARSDSVPLIYVGFGSVTVSDSAAMTRAIYGAVVQSGVRAIVAKGWSERGGKSLVDVAPTISPPTSVHVLQSVPHDWLFPKVDAVCHHGGAGTTGISLRFGVPTIIHPFFGDQTFWAERVAKLGAGLKVDSLTVHHLSEAFTRATTDRIIKEKAAQVGERLRTEDGPSRAVNFIYQHLDFALERTLHRIERTKPKKSWVMTGPVCHKTAAGENSTVEGEASPKTPTGKQIFTDMVVKATPNVSTESSDRTLPESGALVRSVDPSDSTPQASLEDSLIRKKSSGRTSMIMKVSPLVSPVRSWSKLKKVFSCQ